MKRTTTNWKVILCLLAAMTGVGYADIAVTITLDEFDVSQSLTTEDANPATSTVFDGSLIGGKRTFEFSTTSSTPDNRLRTKLLLGNTDLVLSTEIGDASTSIVTYDGISNYDVTVGGGTHFYMRMDNLDSTADWTISLYDMVGGSDFSTLSLSPGATDILLPFSDFSSVDLTNLSSIAFTIQSTGASGGMDFAFDAFGAAAMVPEPSTWVIVLGTLSAMTLRRRR